jgi:transcriptional regulator with XRE-family HTH domain
MTQPLATTIAGNVRAEMARQNVSARTLAKVLGLSHQSMADRVRGLIQIRPNELEKIAEHLGVPVGRFLVAPSTSDSAA